MAVFKRKIQARIIVKKTIDDFLSKTMVLAGLKRIKKI